MKKILWAVLIIIIILCIGKYGGSPSERSAEAIKIGALLPITGKLAGYGEDVRNAMILAAEKLSTEGVMFDVVYEDSAADAKTSLSAAQKLINVDKVPLVVGGPGSTAALAVAPAFEEGATLFFPISNTPKLNDAGKYIFKMLYDVDSEMPPMAQYLLKKGMKRVGVLYDSSSDSNVVGAQVFQAEFEKVGGKVVFFEGFDSKTVNDFRAQLTKLKAIAPDALYQVTSEKSAGVIVRQAREIGLSMLMVGWSGLNGSDFFSGAGTYADGVVITDQPFSCADAPSAYCETYQARFADRIPQQYGAIAHDIVTLLGRAVEEMSIKGPDIDSTEKQKLIAYFTNHEYRGVSGTLKFDGDGNIRDKDFVFRIAKDGKFVDMK